MNPKTYGRLNQIVNCTKSAATSDRSMPIASYPTLFNAYCRITARCGGFLLLFTKIYISGMVLVGSPAPNIIGEKFTVQPAELNKRVNCLAKSHGSAPP